MNNTTNKIQQLSKLLEKRADCDSPYAYMLGYMEGMLRSWMMDNKQLEQSIDKEISDLQKHLGLSTQTL